MLWRIGGLCNREHVETVPRLIGDASPCSSSISSQRSGDGVVDRLVSFNPAAVLCVVQPSDPCVTLPCFARTIGS